MDSGCIKLDTVGIHMNGFVLNTASLDTVNRWILQIMDIRDMWKLQKCEQADTLGGEYRVQDNTVNR